MDKLERWEFIFEQINGRYTTGAWDGVKNETARGGALLPYLTRIETARDHLCRWAGLDPQKDPDMAEMLSGFEQLCRACAKLMYQYGWADGQAGRIEPPEEPPMGLIQPK